MARKAARKSRAEPAAAKNAAPARTPGRIGKTIDLDNVRRLVQLMIDNDLNELTVADGETRVVLKRGLSSPAPAAPAPGPAAAAPSPAPTPGQPPEPDNVIEITSPMVGTFYSAPSPDVDPYVAVGQRITPESVVCVVEAMKVMNEIRADCAGTVVEICVENAQPVEYGQVLFRVQPD
jgi:acetyl-CoA carboxylase biotin carboxyl carrier protein